MAVAWGQAEPDDGEEEDDVDFVPESDPEGETTVEEKALEIVSVTKGTSVGLQVYGVQDYGFGSHSLEYLEVWVFWL